MIIIEYSLLHFLTDMCYFPVKFTLVVMKNNTWSYSLSSLIVLIVSSVYSLLIEQHYKLFMAVQVVSNKLHQHDR